MAQELINRMDRSLESPDKYTEWIIGTLCVDLLPKKDPIWVVRELPDGKERQESKVRKVDRSGFEWLQQSRKDPAGKAPHDSGAHRGGSERAEGSGMNRSPACDPA
jgi:hypothetical protein